MQYFTMTKKELDRNNIISKLIDKEINGTQAASFLKLSVRHTKRLKFRVKEKGPSALIHANRGKPSNRRMPDKERQDIIKIIHKLYPDFKPGFATEKLEQVHNIRRDPKTIRKIMIEEQLWKPRKKKQREYHAWRQRKDCFGEMEQFDGSYHHWFENRGPFCCLLAAIDDATGIPVKAKFGFDEGVLSVFDFWKEYLTQYGKPRSVYLDKFSTYKMTQRVAQENHDTKTQFQRATQQLNIEPIFAHSPQAKGRVERLFNTLQDRLVKELRLNNISTITQANIFLEKEFLPQYKDKYGVEPKSKTNLHQTLSKNELKELDSILSRQDTRVVKSDFTVSFNNQWLQLRKDQPAIIRKKDRITIEEWTDETIHLKIRDKYLNYDVLPERPKKSTNIAWVIPATRKPNIPSADHPWRQKFILQKSKV
jgi:hypothetical protein